MVSEACTAIENDEFYKAFLQESGKNQDVLNALSFTDQIAKLSEGLDVISTELHSQVKEQHGSLLKQAKNQTNLHESLDNISGQVQQLEASAAQLKAKIGGRHARLENQTRVLKNLHEVSHLLRQTARFFQLYKRLEVTEDLAVIAKILFELEPLMEDEHLKRIDFLTEERSTVTVKRQKVLSVINRDLANGLEKGQLEPVARSLQIFANLQSLAATVDQQLETFIGDLKHSLKACYAGTDVKTLRQGPTQEEKRGPKGPGKTPTLTTSQHFRSKLWSALEWLFGEEIFEILKQVNLLEKGLETVRQSGDTDKLDSQAIRTKFWRDLEQLLRKSFEDAPPHVNQCLQQGLPRLLAAIKSLEDKSQGQYKFNRSLFTSLEVGYLEKCGTNLKTPLNGVDIPNQDIVDAMIRAASGELSVAIVDDNLLVMVAGVVNAVSQDFWNKIEAHVKLGADSKQVFDIPNSCQIQNRELANTIHYHQMSVLQMVKDLGSKFESSEAAVKILEKLGEGKMLVLTILQQLMDAFNAAVNIILLSIHREPGLGTQNIATSGPSLYMKELIDFLQRNWNAHIVPFNDKIIVDQCGRELAKNCIDLFINNISVARPLSSAGRQRLKSDCQHLETALKPIVADLSVLGKHFRLLRSICHMITLTPENLIQSTSEEGIVPSYIILFLLFGHAKQSEFASPHQAADWSHDKLIQWLAGHTSDKERLELVGGAIQKYRAIVRQKNIAQYDAVYPTILSFWERTTKNF